MKTLQFYCGRNYPRQHFNLCKTFQSHTQNNYCLWIQQNTTYHYHRL